AYSVSKALSEQLAWRLAARHGLELTVVRPCAIYGAFDPNFTAVFRRLVGLPLTVMPALMHLPLVYAGDVAEAIARALEQPVSIGRAYNVTGDEATMWEFASAWREAGGRGAPVQLPAGTAHGRRRTRPVAAAVAALAIHVSAAGKARSKAT